METYFELKQQTGSATEHFQRSDLVQRPEFQFCCDESAGTNEASESPGFINM